MKGDFTSQEQMSYCNWLDRHPTVKWGALAGLALGAIAMLTLPAFKDGDFL